MTGGRENSWLFHLCYPVRRRPSSFRNGFLNWEGFRVKGLGVVFRLADGRGLAGWYQKASACTLSIKNSQRNRSYKSYLSSIDLPYRNSNPGACFDMFELRLFAKKPPEIQGLNVLHGQRFVAGVGDESQ